jgi:hypothetical protein
MLCHVVLDGVREKSGRALCLSQAGAAVMLRLVVLDKAGMGKVGDLVGVDLNNALFGNM